MNLIKECIELLEIDGINSKEKVIEILKKINFTKKEKELIIRGLDTINNYHYKKQAKMHQTLRSVTEKVIRVL